MVLVPLLSALQFSINESNEEKRGLSDDFDFDFVDPELIERRVKRRREVGMNRR